MSQLLNNMNTPILQVPLGFIRILQLPMAILAFACTSRYDARGGVNVACEVKASLKEYPVAFAYPFKMAGTDLPGNLMCNGTEDRFTLFSEGFGGSSQFFVFVGVISMLYIFGILAVYLLLWPNYENDARFANADFLMTAVLGFFWFIGSCAWASGVSGLKYITSDDALNGVIKNLPICKKSPPCSLRTPWDYASLNVSLIAGFTCMALFLANLWFIYKETAWFKARSGAPLPAQGQGGGAQPAQSGGMGAGGSQPAYR